jgi:glyoxylase-like metal-dependent hydrolase (beta-lactamase superfamily II)
MCEIHSNSIRSMSTPDITAFHDPATGTVSYLVADPATKKAAIIDPVLNYEANSGRTSTTSADEVLAAARQRGLTVQWVLETHVHADHLTASAHVKQITGAQSAIGAEIEKVQKAFGQLFNILSSTPISVGDFDKVFRDGESFTIGSLTAKVIHTPGHTPACLTYLIGDAAFVGDTIFMPDYGTARCDFPGGDAAALYQSIQKILSLPDSTRIFVGHDYGTGGREIAWETTVAAEKQANIHVGGGKSIGDFVEMRKARDKTLPLPNLILPSVQVNIRGGRLPTPEANGIAYLKMPINAFS